MVSGNRLKHYGVIKLINGVKTLFLEDGVHVTKFPILDSSINLTIKSGK